MLASRASVKVQSGCRGGNCSRLAGVHRLVAGGIFGGAAVFPGDIWGKRHLAAVLQGFCQAKSLVEVQSQLQFPPVYILFHRAGQHLVNYNYRSFFRSFGRFDQAVCHRSAVVFGINDRKFQQENFGLAAGLFCAKQSCRKNPGIIDHQHILFRR